MTAISRDQIIADAKSLPDLLDKAKATDPTLFNLLTGSQAHNVWYPPLVSAVSWLSAHYVLGWSPDTCSAAAGAVLFALVAGVHYLTQRATARGATSTSK